jgi:DNA-binding CsgD family transcriptional regulator
MGEEYQSKLKKLKELWGMGKEPIEISTRLGISLKKVAKAVDILELHSMGYSDTAIASKLNKHQSTVSRARRNLELPPVEKVSVNANQAGLVKMDAICLYTVYGRITNI